MDTIPAPTIPASYANFAKAVGALAESHGITCCSIKITPGWRDAGAQRIHGDVTINYRSIDGRGRPCVNIDVYMQTHTTLPVVQNTES